MAYPFTNESPSSEVLQPQEQQTAVQDQTTAAAQPVESDTTKAGARSYGLFKKGGAVKAKKKAKCYKAGGAVKSSASKRGDGCAQRGKTKGRMV